jgi:hypothetical protein
MAGLVPAIHVFVVMPAKAGIQYPRTSVCLQAPGLLDCPVKPGNDNGMQGKKLSHGR